MQLKLILAIISFASLALATAISDLGNSIATMTQKTAAWGSAIIKYEDDDLPFYTTYTQLMGASKDVLFKLQGFPGDFTEIQGKAIYTAMDGFEREFKKTMNDIINNEYVLIVQNEDENSPLPFIDMLNDLEDHVRAFSPYWIQKSPKDLQADVRKLQQKIDDDIHNTKAPFE